MLDAYIIDRIRRERERERARKQDVGVPLHIPGSDPAGPLTPEPSRPERPRDDEGERGSVVIDFRV